MTSIKEISLISHLRNNGREQLTKISRTTNIPVSTLFDLLKNTKKIKKYTCILDFGKLGYAVRAIIIAKVQPSQREELKSFLLQQPHLNSLCKINNGYDFMFEVIYKDLNSLESFIDELDRFEILDKKVHYVIEDIVREDFLSDPQKAKMFKLIE